MDTSGTALILRAVLVTEKFLSLCHVLGPENVGMITGDATVHRTRLKNQTDPLATTIITVEEHLRSWRTSQPLQ